MEEIICRVTYANRTRYRSCRGTRDEEESSGPFALFALGFIDQTPWLCVKRRFPRMAREKSLSVIVHAKRSSGTEP